MKIHSDSHELKPSSLIASSNQDSLNRRPMNNFKPAIPQRTVNEVKLKKYKRENSKEGKDSFSKNYTFSKQKNPEPKYVKSYYIHPNSNNERQTSEKKIIQIPKKTSHESSSIIRNT